MQWSFVFAFVWIVGMSSMQPENRPPQSDWVYVIEGGSPASIDEHLRKGGAIDANVFSGKTPVLYAATSQRWDLVLHLIERGARLDVVDDMGVTLGESAAMSNVKLQSERGGYLQKVRTILQSRGLLRERSYYEQKRIERGQRNK